MAGAAVHLENTVVQECIAREPTSTVATVTAYTGGTVIMIESSIIDCSVEDGPPATLMVTSGGLAVAKDGHAVLRDTNITRCTMRSQECKTNALLTCSSEVASAIALEEGGVLDASSLSSLSRRRAATSNTRQSRVQTRAPCTSAASGSSSTRGAPHLSRPRPSCASRGWPQIGGEAG
eukprot:4699319-Prymnesium_polylepis.1